ncbi:hypothetical protein ACOME3_004428 [Neoechinorhynchus agilis]
MVNIDNLYSSIAKKAPPQMLELMVSCIEALRFAIITHAKRLRKGWCHWNVKSTNILISAKESNPDISDVENLILFNFNDAIYTLYVCDLANTLFRVVCSSNQDRAMIRAFLESYMHMFRLDRSEFVVLFNATLAMGCAAISDKLKDWKQTSALQANEHAQQIKQAYDALEFCATDDWFINFVRPLDKQQ